MLEAYLMPHLGCLQTICDRRHPNHQPSRAFEPAGCALSCKQHFLQTQNIHCAKPSTVVLARLDGYAANLGDIIHRLITINYHARDVTVMLMAFLLRLCVAVFRVWLP